MQLLRKAIRSLKKVKKKFDQLIIGEWKDKPQRKHQYPFIPSIYNLCTMHVQEMEMPYVLNASPLCAVRIFEEDKMIFELTFNIDEGLTHAAICEATKEIHAKVDDFIIGWCEQESLINENRHLRIFWYNFEVLSNGRVVEYSHPAMMVRTTIAFLRRYILPHTLENGYAIKDNLEYSEDSEDSEDLPISYH